MTIKQIDQATAEALMTRYLTEISQRIPQNLPIDDLFMWSGGTLLAFTSPLIDFGVFNNLVGITQISFSFGLLTMQEALSMNLPRFTLLIKGFNTDRTIQSDYYQLQSVIPITEKLPEYNPPTTTASSLAVPGYLYSAWTKCWSSMLSRKAELCSIDIVTMGNIPLKVPLQKYIFNSQDAINTLYPVELVENVKLPPKLYVCVVNHCQTHSQDSDNHGVDKIGLMLGVAQQQEGGNDSYKFISSCYDFSAPCPPTCP